ERRGMALVTAQPTTLPALAIPVDAAPSTVRGGALVLDGAAAMIELEVRGKRQLLMYDLRRGTVMTRVRLGDAAVVAVAEKRGIVLLGRGSHVARLDLRAGSCTSERILPAPFHAIAVDADGSRVLVADDTGVRVLGAALTELDLVEASPDVDAAP